MPRRSRAERLTVDVLSIVCTISTLKLTDEEAEKIAAAIRKAANDMEYRVKVRNEKPRPFTLQGSDDAEA